MKFVEEFEILRQNIVRNLLKNSKVRNEFFQGAIDFQRYVQGYNLCTKVPIL